MRRAAVFVLPALLFVAAAVFLFARGDLRVYADSAAYRNVARQSLASRDFWAGERPFVLPLAIKLAGRLEWLVRLQLVVYLSSALALAAALARLAANRRVGAAAFSATLGFALSPQLAAWCNSVASESLAVSLFFLGLALASLLVQPPRRFAAAANGALVVVALLWVFTRDANAWFLVILCGSALVVRLLVRGRQGSGPAALVLAAAFGVLLISSASANRSCRWRWPLANVIGQRILPHAGWRGYFVAHGMPINDKVMCFNGQWGSDCHDDLSGFQPWLDQNAKRTYLRFLLTHRVGTGVAERAELRRAGGAGGGAEVEVIAEAEGVLVGEHGRRLERERLRAGVGRGRRQRRRIDPCEIRAGRRSEIDARRLREIDAGQIHTREIARRAQIVVGKAQHPVGPAARAAGVAGAEQRHHP